MNKDDNTETTCRICLQNNNKELKWIFDTNYSTGKPLKFSEMLKVFAKVEVSLGDGLPERICADCARDTIKTYLFKMKCEKSDKTLRNRLEERSALMHFVKIEIQEVDVLENVIKSEIEDNNSVEELLFTDSDRDGYYYIEQREDNLPETIVFEENRTEEYNQFLKSNRETILEGSARDDIASCNKMAEISRQFEMIEEKVDSEQSRINKPEPLRVNEKITFPVCLVNSNQISNLHNELRNFQLKSKGDITEQLHECEICKKKFAKASLLKNHNRRMHTREKPYECNVCGVRCSALELLQKHERRFHIKERPYECDVCKKKFTLLYILNVHKRIHTGETPYECYLCKVKFTNSGSLSQHKRTQRHILLQQKFFNVK